MTEKDKSMWKNLGVAVICLGVCLSAPAKADEYDVCIAKASRYGTENDISACMHAKTLKVMRQIQAEYAKMARDGRYRQLNSRENSLQEQFNNWQKYRNNFCKYYGKGLDGNGGSENYMFEYCMMEQTDRLYNELAALSAPAGDLE